MPKKSLSGTDRYNFMLALTGYLINHRQQPIASVAEHFGVSIEDIRSMVVTISLSGVGNYRPDELFFLDYDLLEEGIVDLSFAPTLESVPRLSTRQAAAIASGLGYLTTVLDPGDAKEIENLIGILGSGSGTGDQLPISISATLSDGILGTLRQAIAQSRVISCIYRNSQGEIEQRQIEPWILESIDANWYLRGYCLKVNQLRVFRLDRMRDATITDISCANLADLNQGTGEIYLANPTDTQVLFEVDPEAYSFIADFLPELEIPTRGKIEVRVPISRPENLGRIVAKYGGALRVLAPESARRSVREFALAALGESSSEILAE
jgi:proteasome accessory factor C